MKNEFYRSLTDELHALNHQIHTFLSPAKPFLPAWGLASSLRQLLRKYISADLAVARGIIVHTGACSELIEVLVYSQDYPLLYREGDTVFVSPQAVRGVLSVVPEDGDLTAIESSLRTLGAAVSQVNANGETTKDACFSGLLAYSAAAHDADELIAMLECIAGEHQNTGVSALCQVAGSHISLQQGATARWTVYDEGNSLGQFLAEFMTALGVEPIAVSASSRALQHLHTEGRLEPVLLANQEVLKAQNMWANEKEPVIAAIKPPESAAPAERTASSGSSQENIRKKERFFKRFTGKKTSIEDLAEETFDALAQAPEVQGLDKQDHNGNTLLHNAILQNAQESLIDLLRQGANINIKNREGNTPLHLAAVSGQLALTRILLDHGADINARNYIYCSPLHLAAAENKDHVARILLDYGAELEARNNRSLTPLHRAVMCDSADAAEVLIAFGADLHAKTERDIMPLHLAAWYGHINVLQLLIDSEANLNAQNADGNTALHLAAFNSQVKAIKVLINCHANMEIANQRGETYLQRINEGYQNERVLVLED